MSCYQHPNSPDVWIILHSYRPQIVPICEKYHAYYHLLYTPFNTKEEAETAAALRKLFEDWTE